MKVYNKNRDCDVIPDENGVNLDSLCNENLSLNDDDYDYNYDELLVAADEKNDEELDFMLLISQILLEVWEKFNVTTEVTRFVSEKILNIIRIDRKEHSDAIHRSLKKNNDNFVIDHETNLILFSRSPFELPCQHFCGQKSLTNYIKSRESFVPPVEITLGMDSVSGKPETVQYVPIIDTLAMLLKREDVLGKVLNGPKTNTNLYNCYSAGKFFKENDFWSTSEGIKKLEIILYHDDFNVVNPLGNKTSKYKVSAFYFVLGNLPAKYKSRLTDIHPVGLAQAEVITKYGYENVL